MGKCCSLSSRSGSRQSLAAKRFWCIFRLKSMHLCQFHNDTFVIFTVPFGCVQRRHNRFPVGLTYTVVASPPQLLAMGWSPPWSRRLWKETFAISNRYVALPRDSNFWWYKVCADVWICWRGGWHYTNMIMAVALYHWVCTPSISWGSCLLNWNQLMANSGEYFWCLWNFNLEKNIFELPRVRRIVTSTLLIISSVSTSMEVLAELAWVDASEWSPILTKLSK